MDILVELHLLEYNNPKDSQALVHFQMYNSFRRNNNK